MKNLFVQEVTISKAEMEALDLMADSLSGGAGALFYCKCEIKNGDDKPDQN